MSILEDLDLVFNSPSNLSIVSRLHMIQVIVVV